jgi:hypothetical protein
MSGGGIHVYWTLARALTIAEWQPLAAALAEATKKHNLKCDTQCTIDGARVLRIPDTVNRKFETPRPVTLGGAGLDFDYNVEVLEKVLEPYKTHLPAHRSSIVLPVPPASLLAKFTPDDDLAAGIEKHEFAPFKIEEIAKECAFVRDALATGGLTYTNPMWNLTNLVSVFTEGGRVDAHSMGNKHPGYTKESTDEQYDRKEREQAEKGLGWPSCGTISAHGCKACQSCKHFAAGRSPMHAALRSPASALPEKAAADASVGAGLPPGRITTGVIQHLNWDVPKGYTTGPDGIVNEIKDNFPPDPLDFTTLPLKDAVARINTDFFVLRSSGKIYQHDTDGELRALPKQDFKTALGGRRVEIVDGNGNVKRRPAADVWLDSLERREYRGLQYCPNNVGLKPNHLNLWTRWGDVEPAPGDCSIITEHILNIVADGDQAKSAFLLNWLADILQNPTRKPGVCVVLRGRQGCGKSVVGAIERKLLGPKNVLTTSDKDRILGRFNSSVMNKILLVGEEMLFAGDRATTDKPHYRLDPSGRVQVRRRARDRQPSPSLTHVEP